MTRFFQLLCCFSILLLGCGDDDDPVIPNEEEVITDLVYVLNATDNSGGVTLTFSDPDGDGAQPATIVVSDPLAPNKTYVGLLSLSNRSNPADPEDITAEIQGEDDEHQFFFVVEGGLDATVAYGDADENGNPVGLLTELTTGAASTGSLRIILRHEPDKAAGATIGNPAPAGGETDIEVTFPVSIGN